MDGRDAHLTEGGAPEPLLATGLRNKDIDVRPSPSTHTVDYQPAAIFGKLGVSTRAKVVGAAHRLGSASHEHGTPSTSADPCRPGRRE